MVTSGPYQREPLSWDGANFDSNDWDVYIDPQSDVLGPYPGRSIDVQMPFGHPRNVGTEYDGKSIPLCITMRSMTQDSLDDLEALFVPDDERNSGDGDLRLLVCTDGNSNSIQIPCVCLGLAKTDSPNQWVAKLWAPKAIWENYDLTTDPYPGMAGDSQAFTVTNIGALPCYPDFTITPNTVKDRAHASPFMVLPNLTSICATPLADASGQGWSTLVRETWDTAALMTAGECLASGDDIRVDVDGVETDDFWLEDMNTDHTKLWVNIPWSERRVMTTKNAISGSVPADGGSIAAASDDALSDWPWSGYVLTPSNEVIFYGNRTESSLLGIKRAQNGTSAAGCIAGVSLYRLPHAIRVTYGWTGAGASPSATATKPMFDLGDSSRTSLVWPTAYGNYGDCSRRTARWQPVVLKSTAFDDNVAAYEDDGVLNLENVDSTSNLARGNAWEFTAPMGITNAEFDLSVEGGASLQVLADGAIAARYYSADGGSGKTLALTGSPKTITFLLKSAIVTGNFPTDPAHQDNLPGVPGSGDWNCQTFTLDQDTDVDGIAIPIYKLAAFNGDGVSWRICPISSDKVHPQIGSPLASGTIDVSDIPTGTTVDDAEWIASSLASTVKLGAGVYGLCMQQIIAAEPDDYGAIYILDNFISTYAKGAQFKYLAKHWFGDHWAYDLCFEILSSTTPPQPEISSNPSGMSASIGNITLTINNAFDQGESGELAGYPLDCVITNTDTDDWLAALLPMCISLGEYLEIDCEGQTATLQPNGETVLFAISASGPKWLPTPRGANAFTYAELGMTDTDLTVEHRDRW
jgi:hypothetical protein